MNKTQSMAATQSQDSIKPSQATPLQLNAQGTANVNNTINHDMDMDSEFMEKVEDLIEESVEKARLSMQETLAVRVQEVQDEFKKCIEMLKMEVTSSNSETMIMVSSVKSE